MASTWHQVDPIKSTSVDRTGIHGLNLSPVCQQIVSSQCSQLLYETCTVVMLVEIPSKLESIPVLPQYKWTATWWAVGDTVEERPVPRVAIYVPGHSSTEPPQQCHQWTQRLLPAKLGIAIEETCQNSSVYNAIILVHWNNRGSLVVSTPSVTTQSRDIDRSMNLMLFGVSEDKDASVWCGEADQDLEFTVGHSVDFTDKFVRQVSFTLLVTRRCNGNPA